MQPPSIEALKQFPLAHLAIACENVEQSKALYLSLGFSAEEPEIVAAQSVRVLKVHRGEFCIELLEACPAGSGSIAKYIAKKGPGLHHVALWTINVIDTLKELDLKGIKALPGYPQTGANGQQVAFLDPKCTGGVLYELVQR